MGFNSAFKGLIFKAYRRIVLIGLCVAQDNLRPGVCSFHATTKRKRCLMRHETSKPKRILWYRKCLTPWSVSCGDRTGPWCGHGGREERREMPRRVILSFGARRTDQRQNPVPALVSSMTTNYMNVAPPTDRLNDLYYKSLWVCRALQLLVIQF